MRIAVLGGDGYCGWATALYLSKQGHDVAIVDNYIRRKWDIDLGVSTLTPILPLRQRVELWKELTSKTIEVYEGDLRDYNFVAAHIRDFQPDAIVHFAQQRSAPFSMIDRAHALTTQLQNLKGTLNVLFALKEHAPACHLVKLGTMGEYGTPNIDIEEGFIDIKHNGRRDRLPFPKQPGSFYHLSKVHDSHNIAFCCKPGRTACHGPQSRRRLRHHHPADGAARSGIDESVGLRRNLRHRAQSLLRTSGLRRADHRRPRLAARHAGSSTFATPCAAWSSPACTRLSPVNIACSTNSPSSFRCVSSRTGSPSRPPSASGSRHASSICPIRASKPKQHYYNAKNSNLIDLGLKPHMLSDSLIDSLINIALKYKDRIDKSVFMPQVNWRNATNSRNGTVRTPSGLSLVSDGVGV